MKMDISWCECDVIMDLWLVCYLDLGGNFKCSGGSGRNMLGEIRFKFTFMFSCKIFWIWRVG